MARAEGFEPPNARTKTWCLTTWPRPNVIYILSYNLASFHGIMNLVKITKYEHSCLVVEVDSQVLVIDPGIFSDSFKPTDNIDAVIITHEHSDHFDPEKIAGIKSLNPSAQIFTTAKVASQIPSAKVPDVNEKITVGNFTLQFFGHDHAPIVDDIIPCDNIGVIVNETLVYPGDSFELSPVRAPILAAPASAPWLKINETMKYIAAAKPVKVFPTHNALLSQIGQDITYNWLRKECEETGTKFIDLQPGAELLV